MNKHGKPSDRLRHIHVCLYNDGDVNSFSPRELFASSQNLYVNCHGDIDEFTSSIQGEKKSRM